MRRRLSRREFLKVAGAGVAGAALLGTAGCGGQGDEGQEGGAESLEMWLFSEERAEWIRQVLQSEVWTSEHGDVEVNLRVFPYEQMHDRLQTALVSGRGAPDLADVEISRFSPFIRGDQVPFVPLNDRIGDEIDNVYTPAGTDPWTWEGQIYGLGNELNTCVLAYRQDIMEDAGIQTPFETWDQVIEAGREISTADRKMFAIHDEAFGDHYMMSQSAGTTYFDEQGNYIGDNELSIEAMQFLYDLVYEHEIADIAPVAGDDQWYPPNYRAAFRAERFVAVFGPPWHLAMLPLDVPDQSGLWTVQEFPQGVGEGIPTAQFGGTGQCITVQSEKPDLAWELIRACNLTTEGVLEDFKLRTVYPTYSPAYEDPALQEPSDYFADTRFGELYSSLAPQLVPFNQSPQWAEATETIIRDVITPVMQDRADAAEALRQVRSAIEGG
ncbi:extracellular solute-binding protein [Rubrobacter taiwanensis]|jgi:arabinosaccharide transport system substrate-binding protein|uniref:Extracellular solute-binding protein n=1 Tax=Rubrobacter taiwanensis TaxID=185139 RepID=A0A4R1BEL2_9ACTN|nr:extracellular solute-binding protein [Rubrobacter taiwanensis]TCJ15606.1 extracellular solute-binding protein [Rubrobacter taiwanensis]